VRLRDTATPDPVVQSFFLAGPLRFDFDPEFSELDRIFGGFRRGEHGFWLGGSNAGKSNGLVQTFCSGLIQRLHGLYASLELEQVFVEIRMAANLTTIPLDEIENERGGYADAEDRLRWLSKNGFLGRGKVRFFKADNARLQDIWDWVAKEEKDSGRRVDFVCIDADEHLKHDIENTYRSMGALYNAMRDYALGPDPDNRPDLKRWVATASQAKNVMPNKILSIFDTADSQKKHRNSDWTITINRRGDNGEFVALNLGKNRNGPTGVTSLLPTNLACAQLAVREYDPFPWCKPPRAEEEQGDFAFG
jgi:hypothetical protein